MKATRFYGKEDIRTEQIPEPELLPGSVKIKVEWTGICGTDLHEFEEGAIFCPKPGHPHPLTGETTPVVLGHELAGVIAGLGEGVTGLTVGERVALEPYILCGECEYCLGGEQYNLCPKAGYYGLSGWGGGFAEYVVVNNPAMVHPLGELSTEVGALVEPLSVAHHAVRRSGAKAGDTAVVFGAGPIGIFVTLILKAIGVETIYNVEISTIRKEKVLSAGSTRVIDPTAEDVVATIRELTGGRGTDVAFECVAASPALQAAMDSTRSGGTVVNVSIWSHNADVNLFGLTMRELNLVGTSAYANDHAAVIKLLQEGRIENVEQYITGRISVEDVVELGFKQLIHNKEENVKIIVHP
ncbi:MULTISPECIES: 2,3-butanediol dehydrogenase [Subtercola]|uniref:(R,R)-butanediol dehydrogenase/meso-butanediol dehydrogenase/diacetyl reductase n=1 Tax=Subtercola frigoramans TaxID=120298 RepID=A0ABS2L1C6_9MICO|nr:MULTISPECIES: 2,3-butanediol dehydrogenase [Subtercola]MBM7470879.1 (R,R)-butanediol dehydrogenase/meso-butanediol dehydrogenase/diacetyl reductase [Subtercola frigoramans]QWT24413.1 2,3-butanediol dehydrogenase [Subtercola sp. PAMC28395]